MTKKLVAFDLDDTLAVTKSAISKDMAELLRKLLDTYDVAIISGGKFEQFTTQVVDNLDATPRQLSHLHLMPTCGTQYYHFQNGAWEKVYAEDLTDEEKTAIITVSRTIAEASGLWPEQPWGDVIEDRGSQISISFLGQQAPAEAKYAWFEEHDEHRHQLVAEIADRLGDFEARAGGTTTVDITRKGIDKAYGIHKLREALSLTYEDILFLGDKLEEGGNDYPVRALGVDSIAVRNHIDTTYVLRGLLAVS